MGKSLLILSLLCLSWFGLAALDQTDLTSDTAGPDSLMQSIEKQIMTDFGISYNSTLTQTAGFMHLDLDKLKQELGLDTKNDKLDNMRLRQLGISVYQILLAHETIQFGFNEASTLEFLSAEFKLPVKKLKSLLGLDSNDPSLNTRSIQSLGLELEQVRNAVYEFNATLRMTGSNIIMVGMLVVFTSLFIISLIIMQLRHLNFANSSGKISGTIKLSSEGKLLSVSSDATLNDIVVAITALHMHKTQLEERRLLNLTFQRNKANYWRASGLYSMPNNNFKRR